MNNILKFILLGSGLFIVIALIMIVYFISNSSKDVITKGISQSHNAEMDSLNSIVAYDGLYVTGAEVVKLIKKHESDPLFIRVKTKASSSLYGVYYNYDYDDGQLVRVGGYSEDDTSNEDYINTRERFKATIIKDDLGVLIGIAFDQQ